jgi:hypothetical protein
MAMVEVKALQACSSPSTWPAPYTAGARHAPLGEEEEEEEEPRICVFVTVDVAQALYRGCTPCAPGWTDVHLLGSRRLRHRRVAAGATKGTGTVARDCLALGPSTARNPRGPGIRL